MKKYRRTTVTVRTTEILSQTVQPTDDGEGHFCPLCRAPLAVPLSARTKPDISLTNAELPKQIGPAFASGPPEENEKNEAEAGTGHK